MFSPSNIHMTCINDFDSTCTYPAAFINWASVSIIDFCFKLGLTFVHSGSVTSFLPLHATNHFYNVKCMYNVHVVINVDQSLGTLWRLSTLHHCMHESIHRPWLKSLQRFSFWEIWGESLCDWICLRRFFFSGDEGILCRKWCQKTEPVKVVRFWHLTYIAYIQCTYIYVHVYVYTCDLRCRYTVWCQLLSYAWLSHVKQSVFSVPFPCTCCTCCMCNMLQETVHWCGWKRNAETKNWKLKRTWVIYIVKPQYKVRFLATKVTCPFSILSYRKGL